MTLIVINNCILKTNTSISNHTESHTYIACSNYNENCPLGYSRKFRYECIEEIVP